MLATLGFTEHPKGWQVIPLTETRYLSLKVVSSQKPFSLSEHQSLPEEAWPEKPLSGSPGHPDHSHRQVGTPTFTYLFLSFLVFETGYNYVAQVGLELTM